MTENRRVFWNIIATYGRSVFALVCGLLTGRWVLNSLGTVDYGLYGVVACLVTFIGFFNGILIGGCTRFYAISIGQAKVAKNKTEALEECRKWFNTALTIETVIPFVVLAIGYPIGEWAVRNYLTIPADRVGDCAWAFRCVCLSAFVSMVTCPFNAMYSAKQYIAELTIYSFISTTLNVLFGGYMITHPGVWLLPYAIWSCAISILPNLIIAFRAVRIFPECAIRLKYMWDVSRLKIVLGYSGCIVMGTFVYLLRAQGMTIVINKIYGPQANAAMTVANSVNGQTSTLSGAMLGAFTPAITTAYGAGEVERANRLALRSCKFAVLLSMIFTLPLSLEISEVMRLWLKNPPQYVPGLCLCMIAYYLVDVCTTGHMVAVNASGKIFWYNLILSAISIFTLPIAIVCGLLGANLYWMAYVLIFMVGLNSVGRVLFARYYVGMSVRYWLLRVVWASMLIALPCCAIGWLPHLFMDPSFWRVCVTTIMVESVYFPLFWFVGFDVDERAYVLGTLKKRFHLPLGMG